MKPRPLELVTAYAPFHSRAEAGRMLARSLARFRHTPGLLIVGLARGGVPVARAVADALDAPLHAIIGRKVGVPGIEDVALAAITEGGHSAVADNVAWYLGVPAPVVERLVGRARIELERRVATYGARLEPLDPKGRTVLLVDDGIATGATMRAAIRSVRAKQPARVIVAVPVASRSSAEEVRQEADELVTLVTPARFDTISAAYDDYSSVTDDDVLTLLGKPMRRVSPNVVDISERMGAALSGADGDTCGVERSIAIPGFDVTLAGDLGLPRPELTPKRASRADGVRGLVILAHGGGSTRNSYRNRYIAGRLRLSGYATLRMDLLTLAEQQVDDAHATLRFDIGRLATRLASACEWVEREGLPGAHRTVLLGANTGAAAALVTAANRPGRVAGVVARGGRVDLATDALPNVVSPVLMVVGASDQETIGRHTAALGRLSRGATLVRVARAGHGFEEPGVLGTAAEHIVSWLERVEVRARRGIRWHA